MRSLDIWEVADIIYKKLRFHADQIEIYIAVSRNYSIELCKKTFQAMYNSIIAIAGRVAIEKRVGGASISFILGDKTHLENLIDRFVKKVVKNARLSEEDKRFKSFAYPREGFVQSVFDQDIDNIDVEILQKTILELLSSIDELPNIRSFYSTIDMTASESVIINSNGVNVKDEGTAASFTHYVQIDSGSYRSDASTTHHSRTLKGLLTGIPNAISEAYRYAKESIYGKELKESIMGDLIVKGNIVFEFILPLLHHLNALEVIENRSIFKGKVGEKITSSKLTLIDDGTIKEGLLTSKYDGEGLPKTRNVLIQKGVLRDFLYDSYTAYYLEKESTSNAHRSGEEVYPDAWNIIISPGRKNVDELISECDIGFLVRTPPMGVHLSDYITGDFSLTFDHAILIKNGEKKSVIKPLTVNGNFFTLLNSIEEIGSDPQITPAGIFPSVVFSDVNAR